MIEKGEIREWNKKSKRDLLLLRPFSSFFFYCPSPFPLPILVSPHSPYMVICLSVFIISRRSSSLDQYHNLFIIRLFFLRPSITGTVCPSPISFVEAHVTVYIVDHVNLPPRLPSDLLPFPFFSVLTTLNVQSIRLLSRYLLVPF